MSDDLGSFFAEISTIEETVNSVVPAVDNVTEKIQSQIISKPAEIKSHRKESHAVYTYDIPDTKPATNKEPSVVDPYAHYTSIPTSSSYNSLSYPTSSYSQFAQSSGPVAPPMEPRQSKTFVRSAADEVWVDETLNEWPDNDYRIFVGDLGKEVTTEHLAKHFQNYKSFAKAKVVRDKTDNKTRGYGFVSFLDPMDCAKAIREQNGKYLGPRPMKISKSSWKDRDIKEVKKKENKKRKMMEDLGLS